MSYKRTVIKKETDSLGLEFWTIEWWEGDECTASDFGYHTKQDAIDELKRYYGETEFTTELDG